MMPVTQWKPVVSPSHGRPPTFMPKMPVMMLTGNARGGLEHDLARVLGNARLALDRAKTRR